MKAANLPPALQSGRSHFFFTPSTPREPHPPRELPFTTSSTIVLSRQNLALLFFLHLLSLPSFLLFHLFLRFLWPFPLFLVIHPRLAFCLIHPSPSFDFTPSLYSFTFTHCFHPDFFTCGQLGPRAQALSPGAVQKVIIFIIFFFLPPIDTWYRHLSRSRPIDPVSVYYLGHLHHG